nr:hypothetical protein Iba_chr02bCG11720 [Ipomoea batatas]
MVTPTATITTCCYSFAGRENGGDERHNRLADALPRCRRNDPRAPSRDACCNPPLCAHARQKKPTEGGEPLTCSATAQRKGEIRRSRPLLRTAPPFPRFTLLRSLTCYRRREKENGEEIVIARTSFEGPPGRRQSYMEAGVIPFDALTARIREGSYATFQRTMSMSDKMVALKCKKLLTSQS